MENKRLELLEPEHRCKKCKTPLNFLNNYCRSDKEISNIIFNKTKGWSKLKLIFYMPSRFDLMIDPNRQYWKCPKCFEEYLVTLK